MHTEKNVTLGPQKGGGNGLITAEICSVKAVAITVSIGNHLTAITNLFTLFLDPEGGKDRDTYIFIVVE